MIIMEKPPQKSIGYAKSFWKGPQQSKNFLTDTFITSADTEVENLLAVDLEHFPMSVPEIMLFIQYHRCRQESSQKAIQESAGPNEYQKEFWKLG